MANECRKIREERGAGLTFKIGEERADGWSAKTGEGTSDVDRWKVVEQMLVNGDDSDDGCNLASLLH